jgi:cap1 methyltransferase
MKNYYEVGNLQLFYPQTLIGSSKELKWYPCSSKTQLKVNTFDCSQSSCQLSMSECLSDSKSIISDLGLEFELYRGHNNPYEKLGKGLRKNPFINRSALKLANLDCICNLILSDDGNNDFTFLDICGGPGGFTEYIFRKFDDSRRLVTGFGISLYTPDCNSCNWNMERLCNIPGVNIVIDSKNLESNRSKVNSSTRISSFHVMYGVDHSGDICNINNRTHLEKYINKVLSSNYQSSSTTTTITITIPTNNKYVDFICCDGGIDVEDNYANTEMIHINLFINEILIMIKLLKHKGDFVMKVFSCQEVFINILY